MSQACLHKVKIKSNQEENEETFHIFINHLYLKHPFTDNPLVTMYPHHLLFSK